VGSSLAALARAPRAPSTRSISSQLTYDTELRWTVDPEAYVTGYEVV
jgi:hypothetical protein